MSIRRRLLLATPALLAAPAVLAQSFPERPLKIVVPYVPGGTTDLYGRLLAQGMSTRLGQPVVVENRGGAGGSLAGELVAKSRPDGYTLMVGSNGPLVINTFLQARMGYVPERDLQPLGLGLLVPMVLVVRADSPYRTVQELVAAAKAQPGRISGASTGNGSSNHLALELFNAATGAQLTHIPYRGSGPMITDLVAGNVACMFDQISTSIPLQRDGQARMLAVTTNQRAARAPEVPTLAEAGIGGAEMVTFMGLCAPAGLPAEVQAKLVSAMQGALAEPALRERLEPVGAEIATGALATPEGFAAFLREDTVRVRRAVELAGLKPE